MRAKVTFVAAAIAALAIAVPAAQDADRSVKGGGIMVKGWQGRVDAGAAKKGQTINDSRFEEKNGAFHISAGSASTYWNPANSATGINSTCVIPSSTSASSLSIALSKVPPSVNVPMCSS